MPIYYNQSTIKEVILKSDAETPEESRAVFLLRPPSIRDRDRLQSKVMAAQITGDDGEITTDAAKMFGSGLMTDALLCTLVGWRGWKMPSGEDVEFVLTKRGLVNEYSLGQLAPADQLDLAVASINLITVGGSESD